MTSDDHVAPEPGTSLRYGSPVDAPQASASPPITVFIGTKAQYIKTAPLLRLMQDRGIDYHLVDSGQHAEFARTLRAELQIKEPDVELRTRGNITTVASAAGWLLRYACLALLAPGRVRREVFHGRGGVCVVHGDTPSTLLAVLMAKRAGLHVAHIEAGLRSFKLWKPFPEELIRIICMRSADYLFAPSEWAAGNLRAMRVKGEVVTLSQNTNLEALHHALATDDVAAGAADADPYCVFTVHRVETILNPRRLQRAVELAAALASDRAVVFVMHPPTRQRLVDAGLLETLSNQKSVTVRDLQPHGDFLRTLSHAEFVVTDGGSIQEECYYLGVPCLVLRTETERNEGVGANVRLNGFDPAVVDAFLRDLPTLRHPGAGESTSPSAVILDRLTGSGADRS